MAEDEGPFLSRWARRKAETRPRTERGERPDPGTPLAAEAEAPDLPARRRGPSEEEGDPEVIAKLPDIDSLDEKSDFSAFMQEGVPQALKRRALRRLWRLNPIFASLDGLNDYDDDFTDAAMVVEGMQTLFQVGKGMPDPREQQSEATGTADAGTDDAAGADAGSEGAGEDGGGDERGGEKRIEAAPSTAVAPPESTASPSTAPDSAAKEAAPAAPGSSRGSALARRWGGFES